MSDSDSLREDIARIAESFAHYAQASGRAVGSHDLEIRRLWEDRAELRDELHALANRLEALTNFVVSDPAEVAAKIVTDANRATTVGGTFPPITIVQENLEDDGDA